MVETTDRTEAAIAALAERDDPAAGDEYTRAAWTRLADPREGLSPFDADDKGWVGHGLAALAAAGLAYRVAGQDARASRRAVEGVAVARDLKTGLDAPAQRACLRRRLPCHRRCRGRIGSLRDRRRPVPRGRNSRRESAGPRDDAAVRGRRGATHTDCCDYVRGAVVFSDASQPDTPGLRCHGGTESQQSV